MGNMGELNDRVLELLQGAETPNDVVAYFVEEMQQCRMAYDNIVSEEGKLETQLDQVRKRKAELTGIFSKHAADIDHWDTKGSEKSVPPVKPKRKNPKKSKSKR